MSKIQVVILEKHRSPNKRLIRQFMCMVSSSVDSFIQKHTLIPQNSTLIVAVSGGADSICMLHILHALQEKLSFRIHIAHVNHGLRANADTDANFVKKQAQALNCPITLTSIDVRNYASRQKMSIEEAARDARRTFLQDVAHQEGASRIALGHTQNDQAETLLFRFIRGTSLTGIAGIRPIYDGLWIHPLLNISRHQVEDYVTQNNLRFCHDETNDDLQFARNKIRHKLVPYLKDHFNPQIEPALNRFSELAQEDEALLEKLSSDAFEKATLYKANRKIILDVMRIFGYHISLRRRLLKKALFELGISQNTVTFDTIERLTQCLEQSQKNIQISADISAHHSNGLLVLSVPTPPFQVRICQSGKNPIPTQNACVIAQKLEATNTRVGTPNDHYTVFFDADQLPSSLYVRAVQPGDRIQPFGLHGSQKVSKLLVDRKIPRFLRDEVPVLVGNNQILWVLGLRRSGIAPITPNTKNIQKLIFEGGWQRIISHPETR